MKKTLENFRTLREPDMVIMRENIIRSQKENKILEVEMELDKWL